MSGADGRDWTYEDQEADEARRASDAAYIVRPGDEEAVLSALVGQIIDLEPVCPLCGHVGASRLYENDEGEGEEPCYLTWCAAGVTAAVKQGAGATRYVPGFRVRGVKCGGCGYVSPPHAFCRPTGPAAIKEQT